MPSLDGTGPMGKGPMTGKCSVSCILRIPDDQDESIQGFAGETGRHVSFGGKPQIVEEVLDMPRCDRTVPTGWQRSPGFGFGGGTREFVDLASALDLEPEPQLETLKARAGYFEKVLEGIKRRIQKLESGTEGNQ